jgi:glycosyltransferase involved in cell wall biosynthesis
MGSAPRLDVAILLSTLASVRGGLETTAVTLTRGLSDRGHHVTLVAGGTPLSRLPDDLKQLPARWILVPYLSARSKPWRIFPVTGLPFRYQSASFNASCKMAGSVRALLRTAAVTMSFLPRETACFSAIRQRFGRPHVSYFPGGGARWWRADQSTVRLVNPAVRIREQDMLAATPPDGVFHSGVPKRWLEGPYEVRPAGHNLLFVGRLEDNKGVLELLDIFRELSKISPSVTLRIVGDGPLRETMSARLLAAGLSHKVTFTGAVSQEAVRTEMMAADVLLCPTHFENFPLTLLEASAAGLPFVASEIEGIRGLFSEGTRLATPGNTPQWVETVSRLLENPQERLRLSDESRRWAAGYPWDAVIDDVESHLLHAMEICGGDKKLPMSDEE